MRKNSRARYAAVVIGVSTGGIAALKLILGALPSPFPVPVLVVTHITPDSDDSLAVLLDTLCSGVRVKEADEMERIVPGVVYLAPANYHLLVEKNGILALSVDPPVNYARPSVDVLFQSAAEVFGPALIGVILTGAGYDGSKGLLKIHDTGGVTVVQDPADAEMNSMPATALQLHRADHIVPLNEVAPLLARLVKERQ